MASFGLLSRRSLGRAASKGKGNPGGTTMPHVRQLPIAMQQPRDSAAHKIDRLRVFADGSDDLPAISAKTWTWCVVAAYAIARVLFIRAIPLNSDEPQHAHVVWAWSQGLVPYRDVFDNHAPLFDLVFSPLMRRLGETPDVVAWMRLAMVPIATLAMATSARIARTLWSPREALLAIGLTATFPPYFLKAGEFRTDGLWALCWLATLLVAVSGRWSGKRALVVGILIGACLSTSLKSVLLLAGLGLAWTLVQGSRPSSERPSLRTILHGSGMMFCGALLVPMTLLAIVHAKGGLTAMGYDVWTHNLLPDVARTRGALRRLAFMAAAFALLFAGLRHRRADATALGLRRALVVVSALSYLLLLLGIWPLLTQQDYLPVIPVLMMGVSSWWIARGHERWRRWASVIVPLVGIVMISTHCPLSSDRLARYRSSLTTILAITSPRDPVMDDKGEAVFRMRPFYFALEDITLARIRRGSIPDDIPRHLLDSDTHVLWMKRLPVADRAFVTANYIPIDDELEVSGRDLGWMKANTSAPIRLSMPGEYMLFGPAGLSGAIDGKQATGTMSLAAGVHWLTSMAAGHYVLIWGPAAVLSRWGRMGKQ